MARRRVETPADRPMPAAARLLMTHGPTAVMEAEWRDPDDDRPDAKRNPRSVRGHRAYDPLRWSRRRHGDASTITEMHIHAADRLRLAFDVASLGGLPGAIWAGAAIHTPPSRYLPSSGPTASAMAMSRAHREFRRALAIFLNGERRIIASVVLEGKSVSAWTRDQKALGEVTNTHIEGRKLVGALDKLVGHYDTEIKEDMAMGRVEA